MKRKRHKQASKKMEDVQDVTLTITQTAIEAAKAAV